MSNIICVVTSSKAFRDLLAKSGYSEGTLKSIIYEYLNNKQYQEAGRAWPSDEYVLNYFNKKFVGSPAQVSVWDNRYSSPHIYTTYQEARAAKEQAMTWFNEEQVYVYENNDGSWTMRVSRPLNTKEINKQSKAWLRDIQNTVDQLINSGVSGRYIQTGNKIHDDKTQPALNSLSKILDNFYLRRGLKVQAKWSKARQKWIVSYANEEKPFIDDWDDVNDTNYIWNEGQQNAINTVVDFLNDHRPDAGQFIRINGKAGTGKTSIINEILSRYNAPRSGQAPIVLIGALAHKAKHVLDIKVSEANKKKYRVVPKSIAGMLGLRETRAKFNSKGEQVRPKDEGQYYDTFISSKNEMLDNSVPLGQADIVIIDEASMVSEEYWDMIKENLNPGTKIIFLGDKGQLPPIRSEESVYYGLQHKDLLGSEADSPVWTEAMPEVTLTERVRQGEDNPLHTITDLYWNYSQGISKDKPSLIGLATDENDMRVILEPTTDIAEQSLDLFKEATATQNPNLVKIVAPTNPQVASYNKAIHFLLHPELKNLPTAEAIMPVKDEIVTMYRNLYKYNPRTKQEELVMANGDDGIVVSRGGMNKDEYDVIYVDYLIRKDDGELAEIPVLLNTEQNIQHYEEIVKVLKMDSDAKGRSDGSIALAKYLNYKSKFGDLRLGYATTVHKSQGSTYQTAFVDTSKVFGTDRAKAQMMYTALTRASNITVVSGGGSRKAPSASEIAAANTALRLDRESKGKTKEYGLSQEQIDSIHAETDELTKIIKDALMTSIKRRFDAMPEKYSINENLANRPVTATSVLKAVASKGNEQQKALAKSLIPIFDRTDIRCVFLHKGVDGTAGTTHQTRQDAAYDVSFNLDSHRLKADMYHVILHELVHSLTANRLNYDTTFSQGVSELMDYVKDFLRERGVPEESTWEKRGKEYTVSLDTYGVHNVKEFMAEAMSSPSFQALLKSIPVTQDKMKNLTAWQKLCSLIAEAFRRLLNIQYKQDTNVYDILVPVIADTMVITANQGARGREVQDINSWNLERDATMQAMAAEVVKAMNVGIENKDIHWNDIQVMKLFDDNSAIFNTPDLDKVDIEDVDKPWKSDPSKVNKTRRVYLKGQKDRGYFEVVKDFEDNNYSVHFKPTDSNNPNAFTQDEKAILFQALADIIPAGANVSTWGELSKGGIAGLNRFANLGFIKVGEKAATMKGTGESINIPIYNKFNGVVSLLGYEYFADTGESTKVDAAWKVPYLQALDAKYSTENTPEQNDEITAKIERILASKSQDEVINDVINTLTPQQPTSINIWYGRNGEENPELSNFAERPFYPSSAFVKGDFRTVEGAFQAQKLGVPYNTKYDSPYTGEAGEILKKLEKASGPEAKEIGRSIQGLNSAEWDRMSAVEMKGLIRDSFFQNPTALQALLATGDATLTHTQADNPRAKVNWGKEFPRILMEVREELRNSQSSSSIGGNIDPVNYHLVSGAADGSDKLWAAEARKLGMQVTDITINDWDRLDSDSKSRYEKYYKDICTQIGRPVTSSKYPRRDLLQADRADAIFAIGKLQPGTSIVDGGTSYAVTRGINTGKPIYLFEQNRGQWLQFDYQSRTWKPTGVPKLTPKAAVIGTRQINEAGKAAITGVLNNTLGIVATGNTATQKPQANIRKIKPFSLEPVDGQERQYKLRKNKDITDATVDEIKYSIEEMFETGEIPFGADIIGEQLTEDEIKALNSTACLNKVDISREKAELGRDDIGRWTVGYTSAEIALKQQENTLLNSTLFGNRELRQLSMLTMFKLSEQISKLQSGEESGEDILGPEFKDVDFTKMSRIDILNKIGLSRLFNEVIKERIFNFKLNPALKKNRTLMKKATLIKDNFDAFIRMGYDNLIEREHVAPTGVINGIKSDTDSIIQNEDGDDLTEEEIQEIFGSSVEAWQTGFRQMSTFTNLTKLIRERLDRLYELDEEGNKVVNEWGIEKNIDSHEAVTKILKWTQGATDIFDMINKLKERQNSNPWVSQLIDLLNDDTEEQFRSQFYSNFKKYFQPYHVVYKKKDKDGFETTVIKLVNEDSFVKNTLDTISSLDNAGELTIYNANIHKFNQQALGIIAGARDAITADLGNMTDAGVVSVMNAFKVLNIPVPAKEDMAKLLKNIDKALAIKKSLAYIYKELNANSRQELGDDYRVVHGTDNNKGLKDTKSDYKSLVTIIADAMSDGLESVSYEAGKLHYSFVTPSYLSTWVESMKGKRGDFEEFVRKQYGNVIGWFYNPEQHENQQGPEGWLNYWLSEMMDDTMEADRLRRIFDHTVVLSDNGVAYADKSPAQYLASLLQMYLYDTQGRSAWFRMPMMSNKQSEEYLRFARIHYEGYTDGYKDVILDWLCEKTIYQEINRIRAINVRKALPDANKIANFDKNGTRFHFLPMLNKHLGDNNSELGKLLRKKIAGEKFDETQNETQKFRDLLRAAVKDGIEARYDSFKRTLNEEGIIALREGNSDEIEKVNILQDKLNAANANRILEEFFWNDMFASINIMQLTIIDPAQYKDTEDLQKRLAQLHSPGMRGNVNATINGRPVTDKFTRTIYIADDVVRSEIIPCLEVIKSRVLSQERYQKNAAAKAMMTKQFDFIINTFANTNVTDAQAYTSPTGYRKKMAVFGKWTPRDEELYQKIMSGQFNELDLANVWQPLKPFVYSTIEKDGHNDYMPTIKIGVQNKNSEYCLIMADALMRSQGMQTKLTALFDFMEASHGLVKGADGKWTGTPNINGIDTIQFDSTVKVGKTGVMDINDKKVKEGANKGTPVQPYTYKEIMDMFNSLAGKVGNDYNDMWVHTIPFDDYAIQQETPTHFLEHEQQQGSQDRILIWADMPDVDENGKTNMITVNGKPMTVAEAKSKYFDAVARNIERSKQEVIEKFGLQNRSRKLRNVFLSRILQEEILKDSRYGTDLYWACGLNESGEFNIPLSDPIQSDRIQQLLNSIIKNHINKQMIAGGPVVQVSCYGYSEDLSIRFKGKEGELLKSFKEYKAAANKGLSEEQIINQYKKYLKDNYASVAYYECYAPIYDKNLLKDFMDKDGNVDVERVRKANPKLLEMVGYRIPTEAKYSMTPLRIVGFMPKSAGEGIMLPKEITALSGSDFDIDKLYIMCYQLDRNDNSREVINSIIEEGRLTQKMSGAKFNAREFRQRVNDIISGNIKPESHEQWILNTWNNKHEITYTEPTEGRNADNNTIVATQWAVLTSALAEDQVLSCGNFEELKRVGYMIAALDNGSKYDSLTGLEAGALKKLAYKDTYLQYADTQMQFHKQNMVAAKLIGVFAQSNVSHAFMNTLGGLQLVFPDKFAFKLDGHTISENMDEEYGYDGNRISSVLAQLLAASVDAVKDPVMSKLNISMDTVNAATTLARMGYDLEFIGWFLTHPAIKRLVTRYNNSVAAGNKTSMMKVLREMQTELVAAGTDIQLDTQKDFDKKFFIEDHFRKITTDQEELNRQKVNDWMVLEMYRRLNNISEALRDVLLMTRFNSITSAVGPFASDTMDNKIKVMGFEKNQWISDKSKRAIQNQPILKAFREYSKELEEALLGQNMIQASGVAYAAYSTLHDMMGYMSKKMAREFAKFFISYYVNKGSNPVFDLSDEHRAEVLDKFPKEFMSIKADYSDNFLVKNIMMETDQLSRDVLKLYTRGMSDTQLQNLRSAWADLYEDNKENAFADKDNLAVRLVEYCFFTGSFGFSPKTFISLTPNVVRQALPNYINNCCDYNGMSNDDIMRLVLQFMLNMGYANAGTIEEKDFKKISDTQVEGKSFPNFEGTLGLARVRDANRNIKYYLLERKPEDENFTYTEVSKLGGANQEAFEIDPNRDITQMQSVIKQQSVEVGSKEEDEGKTPEKPVVNNSRLFEKIAEKLGTFNPMSGTKSLLETQAEFNRILSSKGADQLAEILGLPSTVITKVADKLNMPSDVLANNAKKIMDEIDLCV